MTFYCAVNQGKLNVMRLTNLELQPLCQNQNVNIIENMTDSTYLTSKVYPLIQKHLNKTNYAIT